MGKKMILPIIERCGGCRECETVCSWAHDVGVINPRRGRITVMKDDAEGIYVPFMCLQCEEPFCMKVCPTGAIVEDPETGVKKIRADICIGCRMCVIACPFGGVSFDPEKRKSVKCDFCEDVGEPQCVKWCPKNALLLVDRDDAANVKRRLRFEVCKGVLKNTV